MTNKTIRVAVYGTLKRGFSNHLFLQNAEFEGEFKTEPIYTMLNMSNLYPAVVKTGDTIITCEVYKVDAKTLKVLDRLERYDPKDVDNSFYKREEIDTDFGKGWIYFLNSDLAVIPSGNWQVEGRKNAR